MKAIRTIVEYMIIFGIYREITHPFALNLQKRFTGKQFQGYFKFQLVISDDEHLQFQSTYLLTVCDALRDFLSRESDCTCLLRDSYIVDVLAGYLFMSTWSNIGSERLQCMVNQGYDHGHQLNSP